MTQVIGASEMTPVASGLLFGLSLIVAIGAQNTYVLRQGVLRCHVADVVAICSISDIVLICVGVAGAGAVLDGRRWLMVAARVIGAAFLLSYAAVAARRASRPKPAPGDQTQAATSRVAVAGMSLAFTWLNPAVYLDTVILLGSVANAHPGRQWWFAAGAMAASLLWFGALGFGARLFSPVLGRQHAWQVLDGLVALVMVGTAARVLLSP